VRSPVTPFHPTRESFLETMRLINQHSRAHLTACGALALTLAGLAIAGCGADGKSTTTHADANQAHAAATTAQRRSTATPRGRRAAVATDAGKAPSTDPSSNGAQSTGKRTPTSAGSDAAHTAHKVASSGAAVRRSQSHAGAGTAGHAKGNADSSASQVAAGAVLKTLSGTGNAALGKLTEKTATVLQWHASGSPIVIFTVQGFRLVSSPASSGRVKLTPGEYSGLRIAAKGAWTIELRAVA